MSTSFCLHCPAINLVQITIISHQTLCSNLLIDIPHWTAHLFSLLFSCILFFTQPEVRVSIKDTKLIFRSLWTFQWLPVNLRSIFKTVTWLSGACIIHLNLPLSFALYHSLHHYTSNTLTISHSWHLQLILPVFYQFNCNFQRCFFLFSQSKLGVPLIFSPRNLYFSFIALINF